MTLQPQPGQSLNLSTANSSLKTASTEPKQLNASRLTAEEYRFLSKRRYYDNVLIDSRELALRVNLDDPRRWTPAKKPCAILGMLGMLPSEIQLHVFAVTPISTLFDLRATNSHAKQLIEQWQPFQTAMTEGSDAVRALVATGAGNLWTTQQIVDTLFTTQCEFCGEHGELLQLLKLKRCCFRCLSQERELLAVSERYACEVMKLEPSELAQLPLLRSLPQKCFWGSPARERRWLFDFNSALKVVRQHPRAQRSRPPAPSRIGNCVRAARLCDPYSRQETPDDPSSERWPPRGDLDGRSGPLCRLSLLLELSLTSTMAISPSLRASDRQDGHFLYTSSGILRVRQAAVVVAA
ncbi:hypothetical protein G647_05915 [Cladophialophora carrionii CBS 160.54]|uniref:F-box domain-containing protein n=1 Tax=Cladophialophora carrionii CBS 160.54 TaxID=1279043 RepID=V9D5B6_9EURO|nr:uncharacterized protein G647_05915 [Cladophialophora carrionii CBS 160.54]ETI21846.1 hypothetical protein G647_05915 [Cladophialophora carrionii CBS 160.54]